jgi:ABC-2 type transport system permease protein
VHKLLAVIRREFLVRVRTRVFLIGTVLGPLMMGLLLVFPMLLEKRDKAPKRIAVLDAASGDFGARVEAALVAARKGDDPAGLPRYEVHRIAAGEGNLLMLDSLSGRRRRGPDRGLTGCCSSPSGAPMPTPSTTTQEQRIGLRQGELQRTCAGRPSAGGSAARARPVVRPRRMAPSTSPPGERNGSPVERRRPSCSLYVFCVIALLLYGTQVMTSVLEEKSNRIMEVLVSSLSPFQLMLGKVIGVGLVGLLQLSIWAGTATLLTTQRAAVAGLLGVPASTALKLPIPEVSGALVAVFLLFFVLGFFLYAAAYAAGRTATRCPRPSRPRFR